MPLVCPKCQRRLLLRHSTKNGVDNISSKNLTVYCEGQIAMTPCDFEFEVIRED